MEIEITKMTSRGQVVIPQDIREKEGMKEGEKFLVVDMDGTILLKRVKNIGTKNTDDFERAFRSMWRTAKASGLAQKDVEKEIKANRKGKHAS